MPYAVTHKNGTTGPGEVVWCPGQEPLLYYDDFLWTAAQAIEQELECVTTVSDHPTDDRTDAEACRQWGQAVIRAAIDRELADEPSALRRSMEQLCLELLKEPLEGDDPEETAA